MTYRIVADSSSDILALDDPRYGFVPMKVVTAEREYIDDSALDVGAMVADLAAYKGRSGSSCPNAQEWLDAFGDAEGVFAVTITSALSGSYASAVQACEEYGQVHPGARACAVDSLSTGPEMGLLVEKLLELTGRGLPFDAVASAIGAYKARTHLLFSLESLKNLARNGRTSPAVAAVAGVLGIRIVGRASEQGTLQPLHKCRGAKRALRALRDELAEMGFAGGKARIGHCQNPDGAAALRDLILERWPASDVQIRPCRGLCSFYAESGGLLLGFEEGR